MLTFGGQQVLYFVPRMSSLLYSFRKRKGKEGYGNDLYNTLRMSHLPYF